MGKRVFAATIIGAMVGASVVFWSLVYGSVHGLLESEARNLSEAKVTQFVALIPELDVLLTQGRLTDAQESVLRAQVAQDTVRGLRIHDVNGQPLLSLDKAGFHMPGVGASPIEHPSAANGLDPDALIALADGITHVRLATVPAEDTGTDAVHLAVVSVPVAGADGQMLGVVSVELDQTEAMDHMAAEHTDLIRQLVIAGLGLLLTLGGVMFALRLRLTRQTQAARDEARFDQMTGLLTRAAFEQEVTTRLNSARRSGAAVAFIDIDYFKQINDTHGHAVGDQVLVAMAARVKGVLRERDLAARFGGDEFVLFLDGGPGALGPLGDRLVAAAQVPVRVQGRSVPISISVGLCMMQTGGTLGDAIRHADHALYHAEANGRNRSAVYSDAIRHAREARSRIAALLAAPSSHRVYDTTTEPMIDTRTGGQFGRTCRVDLRALDPVAGGDRRVPRDEVLLVAAEQGLVDQLTSAFLREAATTLAEPAQGDGEPVPVWTDLGAAQWTSGGLLRAVEEALDAAELPPGLLNVSIANDLVRAADTSLSFQLDGLVEIGVKLRLTGFGAAGSRLETIWRYPFDLVTLHPDLTQAAVQGDDPSQATRMVEALVQIADRIPLMLTAQGVRSAREAEVLSSLGVTGQQGPYHAGNAPVVDQDRARATVA